MTAAMSVALFSGNCLSRRGPRRWLPQLACAWLLCQGTGARVMLTALAARWWMYRYPAEESEWTEGIPGEVANGLSLIPVLRSSKRSSSSSLVASPAPILTSRPPTWTRGSGARWLLLMSHESGCDQHDARRV